jgi:hypothetical protein
VALVEMKKARDWSRAFCRFGELRGYCSRHM